MQVLTETLKAGTPRTKQVYANSARFHKLHDIMKSIFRRNNVDRIVMLETWGDYFEITKAHRQMLKGQPLDFKPAPHQRGFVPVQYRYCDITTMTTAWINEWKQWATWRNGELFVQIWLHKPVPMHRYHGGKIDNTHEEGDKLVGYGFEGFINWREELINSLRRKVIEKKLNVEFRYFEELHGENSMQELYREDGLMPNAHGPLGKRWLGEVRKFFLDETWGPEKGANEITKKVKKADMEEIFARVTRAFGEDPNSFRPHERPALCQAMIEAWLRARNKNKNPIIESTLVSSSLREGNQGGPYQSTSTTSSNGSVNRYELVTYDTSQPGNSRTSTAEDVLELIMSVPLDEEWRTPPKKQRRLLPPTPGKDCLI